MREQHQRLQRFDHFHHNGHYLLHTHRVECYQYHINQRGAWLDRC